MRTPFGHPGRSTAPAFSSARNADSNNGLESDVGGAIGSSNTYPTRRPFKDSRLGAGSFQDHAFAGMRSGPPSTRSPSSRSRALRDIGPATASSVEKPESEYLPPGNWPAS